MANEIQVAWTPAKTLYALVYSPTGLVYNNLSVAFEVYASANFANYVILLVELGTGSGFYEADLPVGLLPAIYSCVAYEQAGVSPVEGDPCVATGNIDLASITLVDLAESDEEIDDTTTPFNFVSKKKGTATEILRKKLRQVDGTDITNIDQVIGSSSDA